MRHFVCFSPAVATLPRSVSMAPGKTALEALTCRLHAAGAHQVGAIGAAVALAAITVAADEHGCSAVRAQEMSWGWFHRHIGADGAWAVRSQTFREILTSATQPSQARGATSVGTCGLLAGVAPASLSRPDQFLPYLVRHGYSGVLPVALWITDNTPFCECLRPYFASCRRI